MVTAQPSGFSSIRSLSIQPDGKIVAGGGYSKSGRPEFIVLRYNENGTPDSTFGNAGLVETVFGGNLNSYGNALELQVDGKIVFGGTVGNFTTADFALARYNPNGSLDSSFGVNGLVKTAVSSTGENATELAIQSDGSILLAGYATVSGGNDFAVVRYRPDGTLDSAFGAGGIVTTNVVGNDLGNSLSVQPDGKIILAGGAGENLAVVRYNSDGSLDPTFGSGGKVVTSYSALTSRAMALQPDGKILIAGGGSSSSFTVVRLSPNGSVDTTFGQSGAAFGLFGNRSGVAYGLCIQTDGRVLVAGVVGASGAPTLSDMGVVRFLQNGTLDSSFGTNGVVITDIVGNDWADDVLVQPNGRILLGGRSNPGTQDNSTLVRYVGNPPNSRPDVVLNGFNPLTVEAAPTYSDPGATANDTEDGVLIPAISASNVNPSLPGTYSVTWTVTDSIGLAASATRVVTVRDTTAPIIVAPGGGYSPAVVYFGSEIPDYRFQGVASDFVGVTGLTQSPAPGTLAPLGTVNVTVMARDAAGNQGSHSFDITAVPEPSVASLLEARGQTVNLARPDPAVPNGAVWTFLGAPAVDEEGGVTFVAKWRNPGVSLAHLGLFLRRSEGSILLAYRGGPVDSIAGTTWKEFGAPSAMRGGVMTFIAKIQGAGVHSGNDTVVGLAREDSIVVVAREGDLVPLTDGARYESFFSAQPVGNSPDAEILMTVRLEDGSGAPPVTASTDHVVMQIKEKEEGGIDTVVSLREGSSVLNGLNPGEKAANIKFLSPTVGSAGQARAAGYGLCKTSGGRELIFRVMPTGESEIVASTGDRVGGDTHPLAEWTHLGVPSGEDYLVQRAQLKVNTGGITRGNATAIFGRGSGDFGWEPLAMTGDVAPGIGTGAMFSAFKDPIGGGDFDAGIVFQGTAKGGSVTLADNDAIWWLPSGESAARGRWTLVAREGGQPPGALPGAQWQAFRSLALPSERGPLFTAKLRVGIGGVSSVDDTALYGIGSDGILRELLRKNSVLGGKTVRAFTVLNATRGAIGLTREFNSTGKVVLSVEFTDRTGGIAIISVP